MLADLLKRVEAGDVDALLPLADEMNDAGLLNPEELQEMSELAYLIMDCPDPLLVMPAIACYMELLKKAKVRSG